MVSWSKSAWNGSRIWYFIYYFISACIWYIFCSTILYFFCPVFHYFLILDYQPLRWRTKQQKKHLTLNCKNLRKIVLILRQEETSLCELLEQWLSQVVFNGDIEKVFAFKDKTIFPEEYNGWDVCTSTVTYSARLGV